ncbi:9218_t:CDS:2, partial [Funneliformis geosporum]
MMLSIKQPNGITAIVEHIPSKCSTIRATLELRPTVQPVKARVSTPINAVVTQETASVDICTAAGDLELRPTVQPVKARVSTPINAV